ncbi:ABC transporter substrate-binding protein [Thalassotalea profundi]|uniref:Lipoprotein n=1 Tax=Thalassotalea profundi TaxID=2036687 RepID=A0ABQ3J0U5_9GAMM|nr:ABC transporter substrate-binding protein [Thalassotalea profundi]GHE98985.1 lipoprotein [Thalassotalea profundi]
MFRVLVSTILFCFVVYAEQKNNIVLVSSSALTGPAASLGIKLNQGANLYFDKINQLGGINGQHVKLIMLDDGYEPFKTYQNTKKVLESDELFALFNYVGTPTSHAIIPLLKKYEPLLLTPFSGADFLRIPVKPNIFNLRASYFQEAQAQINYLINTVKVKNIALMVQADEFGDAVEAGYLKVLKQYGLKPVVTTRYRRNTEDIELSLDIFSQHLIDAVAFVGTYEPFARLINLASSKGFSPYFSTVSFISSQDLFNKIKVPARVLVTEVFPDPKNCELLLCEEFRLDAKAANLKGFDRIVFEGYSNAKLFSKVAMQCANSLTKACYINKLNRFFESLGGLKVRFTENDHQGLEQIFYNFYYHIYDTNY